VDNNKENPLRELYQSLETDEIKRRLADEPLTQVEIAIANDELHRRKFVNLSGNESGKGLPKFTSKRVSSVIGSVLAVAVLYWVMPDYVHRMFKDFQFQVIIAVFFIGVIVFGKFFPRIGSLLGWIFLFSPIAFITVARSEGLFAQPFWSAAFLGYIALIFVSIFSMSIGGALLQGSKDSTGALGNILGMLIVRVRKIFKNLFG